MRSATKKSCRPKSFKSRLFPLSTAGQPLTRMACLKLYSQATIGPKHIQRLTNSLWDAPRVLWEGLRVHGGAKSSWGVRVRTRAKPSFAHAHVRTPHGPHEPPNNPISFRCTLHPCCNVSRYFTKYLGAHGELWGSMVVPRAHGVSGKNTSKIKFCSCPCTDTTWPPCTTKQPHILLMHSACIMQRV